MSTSSGRSPSFEKERALTWKERMEKQEVKGSFSVAESGSMGPERKADRWSARTVLTKEEREGVKGAENEKQGWRWTR